MPKSSSGTTQNTSFLFSRFIYIYYISKFHNHPHWQVHKPHQTYISSHYKPENILIVKLAIMRILIQSSLLLLFLSQLIILLVSSSEINIVQGRRTVQNHDSFSASSINRSNFPEGFVFGTGSSSYQVIFLYNLIY